MKHLEKENLKMVEFIDDKNSLVFRIRADDGSNNEINVNLMKLAKGLSGCVSIESNSEDNEALLYAEMINILLDYKNKGVDYSSNRFLTAWMTVRYASE